MRAHLKRPIVILMQQVTPLAKDMDVVSIAGYLIMFEKREDLSARTALAVCAGPRLIVGKANTYESYTKVEVKADACEPSIVSIYIPHSRSKFGDTPPLEQLLKQTREKGDAVIGRDFNSTGAHEMQPVVGDG